MKTTLITLLIVLTASAIHADNYNNKGFGNVKEWFNDSMVYTAEGNADGSVTFTACSEGQDLAFSLSPKPGKKNEYIVSGDPSGDPVNPFSQSSVARNMRSGDQNFICLYDDQERLRDVLSPQKYGDGTTEAGRKWARQMAGKYSSAYGEPLAIGTNGTMRFSAVDLAYRHVPFNGLIMGIIEITGGTRLEGTWYVEITRDGLKFSKGIIDEYEQFHPTGEEEVFAWSSRDIPRFEYAGKILLNDNQFRRLDPEVLRLMRNEIWFHHGYVPAAEDLKEYLADKAWYTPRQSNDGIFNELSLVEKLNIEMIKTAEVLGEIEAKMRKEVTLQVENVYKYIEDIRRYYLDTPSEKIVDEKWQTADNLFGSRSWRNLRSRVDAIDQECERGGFLVFGDKGPFDAWTYDCTEGKVTPQDIVVYFTDDNAATVNFQIKDATTIDPVPMSWMMCKENGEWRVDDIVFLKDDYIDLRDVMEDYIKNGGPTAGSRDSFDFEKYRGQIVELAQDNLNYMKSMDDVRLESYALIDIDSDGTPEIWVRGDEGQDYQGVYSIISEDKVDLLLNSDARSELVFYPSAVVATGYYGDGEFRESFSTLKNSGQADFGFKHVLINNYSEDMEVLEESYNINDRSVSEKEYDAFIKRLGESYQPQVQWHSCR